MRAPSTSNSVSDDGMARQDPATGDEAAYDDPAVDRSAPPAVPADGLPTASTGGAAPVDPAVVRTQPIADEAAAPELREWEWTKGGGLKGRVYGLDGVRPGHKLATSRLIEFSAACEAARGQHAAGARLRHFQLLTAKSAATLCEGALVVTNSHSLYRLGTPRPAAATLDQGSLDAPPCKARVEPVAERAAPAPDSPLETHEEVALAAQATLAPMVPKAAPVAAAAVPSAARANFSADESPLMSPVVFEAEGHQLISASNRTGYMNVSARPSGTFAVRLSSRGKRMSVSGFDTAVAAALWIAKYTAGQDPQTPSGKHMGTGNQHNIPTQLQAATQEEAAPTADPATFSAGGAVVREVEGYTLKLSRTNKTGYMNVVEQKQVGWFNVQFSFQRSSNTKTFHVSGFATAVDAALWFAKYTAGEDPQMPRGGKFRPTGELAPPRPQAPAPTAAAPLNGGGVHTSGGSAAASPPLVAWADGIQLIPSEKSATGYECVVRERGGSFVIRSKRFRNTKRDASGHPKCQPYATAQEAAVAYARLVAVARQQQQPGEDADSDEEMNDAPDESEVSPVVLSP